MRIEKIKNFLVITNFENRTNKIDINTSQILGKKGTQVKNLSPDIKQYLYRNIHGTSHQYADYINAFFEFPESNDLLRYVDKVNALGLRIRTSDFRHCIINMAQYNAIKYDKKLVAYLKAQNNGIINYTVMVQYQTYSFLNQEDLDLFTEFDFIGNNIQFKDQAEVQKMIEWYKYLVNHEYLTTFNRITNTISLVRDYIKKCKELEKEDFYTKNFLLNWCRIAKEHELQKNKLLNNKIKANQENRNLEFSNEIFTVIVPMTFEEMQEESEQQSNCIARSYADYVANGNTNIVFLRLNSNLKKSYLSLEVRQGSIRQALRKHNNQPTSQDWELVNEYKKYLSTIYR